MRLHAGSLALMILAACAPRHGNVSNESATPLPFVVRAILPLQPECRFVASGEGQSAIVDPGGGTILAVWLEAERAAVAGDRIVLLDPGRETLGIVTDSRLEQLPLAGLKPRDVRLSGDGCRMALRCESVLLEIGVDEDAPASILYDRRPDPALPSVEYPFEVWSAMHGAAPPRGDWWAVALPAGHGVEITCASGMAGPRRRSIVSVTRRRSVTIPEPEPAEGDEALVAFVERYPGHPLASSLWGEVGRRRREMGRTEAAIAALERASAIADRGPRDGSLDFELIELHRQRGDDVAALQELDRLLGRLAGSPHDPSRFDAMLMKAEILRDRLRNPDEAVPLYRELLSGYEAFFPEDRTYVRRDKVRLFLGMALESLGERRQALELYEAIVRESVTGTFARYASERASRLGG